MNSLSSAGAASYQDVMRTKANPVLPTEAAAELKATASAVSKRVRAWRIYMGLSQEDVGRIADVSTVLVRSIEGGRRMPTLNVLSRMALVFGVTTEALMFSDPPKRE